MKRIFPAISSLLLAVILAPGTVLAQAGYGNVNPPPPAPRASAESPDSSGRTLTLPPGVVPPSRPDSLRPQPAQRTECMWLGKRTITVLLRDDLIASKGFLEIYTNLGCPIQHIGRAFGCATPAANHSQASDVKTWVDACWDNPEIKPLGTVEDPTAAKEDPNKPRTPPAANNRPDTAPRR